MTNEEIFISNLEVYLGYKLDGYGKKRITGYLKEYEDAIPERVVMKYRTVTRYLDKSVTEFQETDHRPIATEGLLEERGKEVCSQYGVSYSEFRKSESGKSRNEIANVRREFCRYIVTHFQCKRKMLQDFFQVDHTTIIHYLHTQKVEIQEA